MDSARAAPPSGFASIGRTVTKLLRFRRAATCSSATAAVAADADVSIHKLKLSRNLDELTGRGDLKAEEREAMESLVANLFASVSAVKAAYAQLQFAQSPYDPDSIQSADHAVVAELKQLSEMKQSFVKNQLSPSKPHLALAAQLQEHRNLLKTYQITTRKLESELQFKDSELVSLRSKLSEVENHNRSIEAKLHPGRSLSSLHDLHFSGLNPNHFLTVLRFTVKSIRSFVKSLVREMESAGWDLDAAAAAAVQPAVLRRRSHHYRTFAFESFVCQKMFSDFHRRDFNLKFLEGRSKWDRKRFFDEFNELKFSKPNEFLDRKSDLGKFCRAKYLVLVHPKMEASFFGDLDRRAAVSSGRGFPDSEFFNGFAEMTKRVWLLHCLFFSFGSDLNGSIFQAGKGCRFSEVYMESVVEDDDAGRVSPVVGFSVVPGFRLGTTVIQCKVYLDERS